MAEEKDKEAKKQIIKKKAPLTKKKKVWVSILAPDIFGRGVIGETLVEDAKQLVGKTIQLSLMSLTGDMKKQNVTVTFVVDKVVDGNGISRAIGYAISPVSIKRLVRRGRMRVDASFICQTRDNVKVQIKPFLLTAYETNHSTLAAIRKQVIAYVATYAAKYDYELLFKDIVSGKLQSLVREAVHSVYPIKSSEIRMLCVKKDTTPVTALSHPTMQVDRDAPRKQQSFHREYQQHTPSHSGEERRAAA